MRRAHAVHPVADLQIEYSLVSRGPDKAIFPALAELGVGITAYGVLSRGLLAGQKGATATRVAIAWVLAKNPAAVPLVGARTRAQLAESLGALSVSLSPADLARLESAFPEGAVAGTRYDGGQMRVLDSERS